MGVQGDRAVGLGRSLRDVLDLVGLDPDGAPWTSPLVPPGLSTDPVEQLLDDVLSVLCAAYPERLCGWARQPMDDIGVVRLRGTEHGDGSDVLELVRELGHPDGAGRAALMATLAVRDGALTFAVWPGALPFSARDTDVFESIQRLVATTFVLA